ncbi:hypothetical protein SVAN01_01119 [Stagonosporopsis vannaccii]|nr:hypothetical protein SVAN01_01119 [Stagonosporopsis vannaccii]
MGCFLGEMKECSDQGRETLESPAGGESGTVARVQPCKPVAVQYGGGAAICEVIQPSGTTARHQSRSHSPAQPLHFTIAGSGQLVADTRLGEHSVRAASQSPAARNVRRGKAGVIGSAFTAHRNCSMGMAPRPHRDRLLVPEHHANSAPCCGCCLCEC